MSEKSFLCLGTARRVSGQAAVSEEGFGRRARCVSGR